MLARSLFRQEQAMELEFADLPDLVNLEAVRGSYGQLLGGYEQLAAAIVALEKDPPRELLAKVIRAADRWRSIDPDDTAACQSAARVLQTLGLKDLAWDYLTTPLAERSTEAAPWQNLAQALKQQGDFALADRAYATAFEVEPTNAQMLWERAQLLQQTGKIEQARELYRKIADSNWQPRFNGLKNQARNYLR
jgi:tetratricopeptide (TPR) repeat protein